MKTEEKINKLSDGLFQELFGVKRALFNKMLDILMKHEKPVNPKGGRPRKLGTIDKLVIMLEYYHDYPTMTKLAFQWNVAKSQISEAVKWVENTLIKDGSLSLPSKRKLLDPDSEISYVVIDATECRTERPKKNKN